MEVGWIWTVNLRPFVEVLAREVEYAFDRTDWAAIEVGIVGTNREGGPWFDYPIGPLTVRFALEDGATEMVSIEIDGGAPALAERVQWLVELVRDYEVHDLGYGGAR